MCPMCISTVVLIAGSVISTAGLAAIAIKKLGGKNAPDQEQDPDKDKDKDDEEKNNDPKNDDQA
jgi:hypothetical protein